MKKKNAVSAAAAALGKLARGIPKTGLTDEERERRRAQGRANLAIVNAAKQAKAKEKAKSKGEA